MNWLQTVIVLGATFLAVFWEAAFNGVRYILGAQVDLLPALVVYASLCAGFPTMCAVSLFGGLCFDSLSANPLGMTVLPLLLIGLAIYSSRELVLRDQAFAQFTLGLLASTAVPVLTLVLLLTTGHSPLLGWGTLWQITVMGVGGAAATPLLFVLFEWLQRALIHGRVVESSFRSDREIRRGK
jgi:cell shape-determining protein MreD